MKNIIKCYNNDFTKLQIIDYFLEVLQHNDYRTDLLIKYNLENLISVNLPFNFNNLINQCEFFKNNTFINDFIKFINTEINKLNLQTVNEIINKYKEKKKVLKIKQQFNQLTQQPQSQNP